MENMMKRVLSMALAFTMVITGFAGFTMPAYAGVDTISVDKTQVSVGDTVTVTLNYDEFGTVSNIDYRIRQKNEDKTFTDLMQKENVEVNTDNPTFDITVPESDATEDATYRIQVKPNSNFSWSNQPYTDITVKRGEGDVETVDYSKLQLKVEDENGNAVPGVVFKIITSEYGGDSITLPESDSNGMIEWSCPNNVIDTEYAFSMVQNDKCTYSGNDTIEFKYDMSTYGYRIGKFNKVNYDGKVKTIVVSAKSTEPEEQPATLDSIEAVGTPEKSASSIPVALNGSNLPGEVSVKIIATYEMDGDQFTTTGSWQTVAVTGDSTKVINVPAPYVFNIDSIVSWDVTVKIGSGIDTVTKKITVYPQAEAEPEVTIDELRDLVDEIESNLDEDDYTEESWSNLQDVLDEYYSILGQSNADPADIAEAYEAILAAKNALEEKPVVVEPITVDPIPVVYADGSIVEDGHLFDVYDMSTYAETGEYETYEVKNGMLSGIKMTPGAEHRIAISWDDPDEDFSFNYEVAFAKNTFLRASVLPETTQMVKYDTDKKVATEEAIDAIYVKEWGDEDPDLSAWNKLDFTYGDTDINVTSKTILGASQTFKVHAITGLSESGEAKIAENTDVVLPATDPQGVAVNGVAKNALKDKGITSIEFPELEKVDAGDFVLSTPAEGVTQRGNYFIDYGAFASNELTAVDIPEGVIYLGTYAFQNNKLEYVSIPSTMYQIGTGAFAGFAVTATKPNPTNQIETVDFPAKTDFGMEIDNQAFFCNNISNAILPSNISTLSAIAFMNNHYAVDKSFQVVKLYKVGDITANLGFIGHDSAIDNATACKNNKFQSLASITEEMTGMDFETIEKLVEKDQTIEEQAKEIEEQAKEIEEQAKEIEEQAKEIEEKAKEIEEKDQTIEEQAKEIEEQAKQIEESKKADEEKQAELDKLAKEILTLKLDGTFLGLKAKANNYNTVTLTWTPNAEADGYAIFMKTDKDEEWAQVKTPVAGTESSFVFNDLATGTTYQFKVVAGKGDVKGAEATATAKPVLKRVAAPVVKAGKKSVTATWKKVAGANGYQMSVAATKTGTKIVKTGNVVKFTKKSLKAKKTYYVKVRAYRTVNGKKVFGSWSTVKAVKTK